MAPDPAPAPAPEDVLEFFPPDYFRRATLDDIFSATSQLPAELDLGCGDGTFLLAMAAEFPGRNFLGVERLLGRVRKVKRRAFRAGRDNLRLLRLDSQYAVEWLLPRESFDRVHLLFPDPWPKKRHHRRRLFQESFLRSIHRLLKPGGELLFKTDDDDYAVHARTVAEDQDFLAEVPWQEDDFFYPRTDFEAQWLAEGKGIHRLRLIKPGLEPI